MSRLRSSLLILSLTALAASAPAWAQQRGGRGGGGWPLPPMSHGGRMDLPLPPGPLPGRDAPRGSTPMETSIVRPRATPSDCSRAMALSPGDQVLAVQPMDSDGRVQCRVKIMGADGMVRVLMVSPGF